MLYTEEEVNFEHVSRSKEDSEFEAIITALEELLLDPKFEEMQNSFCDRHCGKLDNIISHLLSRKYKSHSSTYVYCR